MTFRKRIFGVSKHNTPSIVIRWISPFLGGFYLDRRNMVDFYPLDSFAHTTAIYDLFNISQKYFLFIY